MRRRNIVPVGNIPTASGASRATKAPCAHKDDGFQKPPRGTDGKKTCKYCSTEYENPDWRSEYCSKECKRNWQAFWQAKGPALARAMYQYRIARADGALSDLCHTFAIAYDDFQIKRRKANAERSS